MSRTLLACGLATLLSALSPALAQDNTTDSGNNNNNNNTTDSDLGRCPFHIGDFNADATVNSTGSVPMKWDALMMDPALNDWNLTLTYNESRNQWPEYVNFETLHDLQGYVSAPEASEARVCVYMFGGRNETSSSGQSNGCDGVLSQECVAHLRTMTFSANDAGQSGIQSRCGSIYGTGSLDRDRTIELCGEGQTGVISTGYPINLGNKTCTIDHPPGSDSPDGYRTWAAMGYGARPDQSDRNATDFSWYDTYVRQTIPFVVAASFSGISETQVVCVAPNQIAEGSRTPPETSGASLNWQWQASSLTVVPIVIGLMLALV